MLLNYFQRRHKAGFAQEGTFLALNLFAWYILLIKKLEIEKPKPTVIVSVLKVEYWVVLVFLNSDFFIDKISQENKLSVV